MEEHRELMTFDIISCIETIEHIADYQRVLDFIKRLCKKGKKGEVLEPPFATAVFISTPNRNSDSINKVQPNNMYHVREWAGSEFYELLTKQFKYVVLMDWKGNPVDGDTKETPIFAKCEVPML